MGDTESGRGRTRVVLRPRNTTPEERDRTDYHVFPDRSIVNEWEFRGTGRETVEWFNNNSNYDELIRSMNADDRLAFNEWIRGHWMRGQMYRDFDSLDRRDQSWIRSYDKILDQSVVREAFVVRRQATAELVLGAGNRMPTSLEQLQALRGKEITSLGAMSTAAASRGLAISYNPASKPIEYIMKFPAGTKGAGMWIGDKRLGHFGPKQREYMVNRDTNFRIGNTTYNRRTGKYEVELIYTGRNEHRYGRSGR